MSKNILKYILFICVPLLTYAHNGRHSLCSYPSKNKFEVLLNKTSINASYSSSTIDSNTDLITATKIEETEEENNLFTVTKNLKKSNNYFVTFFQLEKLEKISNNIKTSTSLNKYNSCFSNYNTPLYIIFRVIKI